MTKNSLIRPFDLNPLHNRDTCSVHEQFFENLVTKRQLAEMTAFSESYINKLMTQGLPTIKTGRAVRFRYSKVMAWLERRNTR